MSKLVRQVKQSQNAGTEPQLAKFFDDLRKTVKELQKATIKTPNYSRKIRSDKEELTVQEQEQKFILDCTL